MIRVYKDAKSKLDLLKTANLIEKEISGTPNQIQELFTKGKAALRADKLKEAEKCFKMIGQAGKAGNAAKIAKARALAKALTVRIVEFGKTHKLSGDDVIKQVVDDFTKTIKSIVIKANSAIKQDPEHVSKHMIEAGDEVEKEWKKLREFAEANGVKRVGLKINLPSWLDIRTAFFGTTTSNLNTLKAANDIIKPFGAKLEFPISEEEIDLKTSPYDFEQNKKEATPDIQSPALEIWKKYEPDYKVYISKDGTETIYIPAYKAIAKDKLKTLSRRDQNDTILVIHKPDGNYYCVWKSSPKKDASSWVEV